MTLAGSRSMAMPLRPLIIVTDAKDFGDDGAAISMLEAAGADIRLIVATNGNVWAEEAAHNVRALLKRCGREDIEVCADSLSVVDERRARARQQDRQAAHYIGALRDSPASAARFEAPSCTDLLHAIDTMNQPDLLVIGPATALAPLTAPQADYAKRIGRIYLMGGAISGPGNATASAEFNFWFDAEAAERLLASDLPITLLPLDAVRSLRYPAHVVDSLDRAFAPARYLHDYVKGTGDALACDEVLAAILLDPTIVERRTAKRLSACTDAGALLGAVSVLGDHANRRPVDVVEQIDLAALWRLVRELFADPGVSRAGR